MTVAHRKRAWTVVALLLAFMVINFMDKTVLGLAGKTIKSDLGLDDRWFGAVGSAFYLLFSVSGAAVGFLTTRIRMRPIMVVLVVCWSLAQAVVAIPGTGLAVLLTSRIMLGAAEGPAYAMANHTAFTWFAERERALPSGVITVGAALGVALGGPLLAVVISVAGWRTAFAVTAALGAIWLLGWLALGSEGPYFQQIPNATQQAPNATRQPTTQYTTGSTSRVTFRRLLTRRTTLGVLAGAFGGYWMLAVAITWLPQYLQRVHGYPLQRASMLAAATQVVGVVAILGLAALAQRLTAYGHPGRLAQGIPAGTALAVAGLGMVLLTRVGGGMPLVLVSLVAFAVGNGFTALSQAALATIVPPHQRGALLGTVIALASTAGVLGPYLTGVVIDASATTLQGFRHAFDLGGALMVVGGLLAVLLINPERDRPGTVALAVPPTTEEVR